jgi:hypothetical protein
LGPGGRNRPGIGHFYFILSNSSFELEVKLQGELRQARVFDLSNLAKLATIGAVTVRVVELCVVE